MIHFLTYHKVSGARQSDADFYTVTCDQFTQHLQSLTSAGFTPLPPDHLVDHKRTSEKQFTLSFDDGTVDHFEIVLPVLTQFNLRGFFFVPTVKLNRQGYLTDRHIRQISEAGHVIGCHSHDHKRLDTLDETELRHQLRTSCQILQQITGKPVWAFAPPGGFSNSTVQRIALETGLKMIRTMRWGFNRKIDFRSLETIPINRHTNGRQFQKILEGKQPHLLYFGKQAAKALVPARAYERLRGWIFKLKRKT